MAPVPSFDKTSRLIARALGLSVEQLDAGFRPATPEELPQVLALRQALIGRQLHWDDAAYLGWRYHFGAAHQGRGDCWVLVHPHHGCLLGMVGSERLTVLHEGRRVEALSLMDIAVPPESDGFGLGVWMAMRMCREVPCVLAVGSNPKSRGIVSQVFSRVPDRRCYAFFLSSRTLARRRLKPRWLATPIAFAIDVGLTVWRGLSGLAPSRRRDPALSVRPIERFDASVEPLIERAHDDREVAVERSVDALNWRLFDIPRSRYQVWGAYRADGRLLGFLAGQVMVSPGTGRALVIEDLLADPADRPAVLRTLLSHAQGVAAAQRCERVSMIACHEPTELALQSMGFIRHGNDYETLSVSCTDPVLAAAFAQGASLHLTGIHTDRDVY